MKQTGRGGRNKIDHILKLGIAKEIAMIQRTDKGKEVRQYFIQLEDLGHLSTKKWDICPDIRPPELEIE